MDQNGLKNSFLLKDRNTIIYAFSIIFIFLFLCDPFSLSPFSFKNLYSYFSSIFMKPPSWSCSHFYSFSDGIYFLYLFCLRSFFFLSSFVFIFSLSTRSDFLKTIIKGGGLLVVLTTLSFFISRNETLMVLGIGYPIVALLMGLLFRFFCGFSSCLMSVAQTEFFMKSGLVLLGAEVLFPKLLSIGLPGILVAWIVTPIVFLTTVFFGRRVLKLPRSLSFVISADMSVCGLSAAIVTAHACRAKKEELVLALSLSLVFTSIMMLVLPWLIQVFHIHPMIGGALIGGTVDSTGAVALASQSLGESAMIVATTVKMIQNILIGFLAVMLGIFLIEKPSSEPSCCHNRWTLIWTHFPKFILGFLFLSIFFSVIFMFVSEGVFSIVEQEETVVQPLLKVVFKATRMFHILCDMGLSGQHRKGRKSKEFFQVRL